MQEKKKGYAPEDDTIDLLELFFTYLKHWWLILLAAILCGAGAGAYSKFLITPTYQSTAMVYILSKETTLTSLADLQIGSQLTKDYQIVVTSRPVLEQVIEELGLALDYKVLQQKLTIDNPKDTRILSITAADSDPYMAKLIADSVAETSSEYIGNIMEMVPPKIIENGVVATQKSSPSNAKNAMIGALAGAALVCGILTLEVLMNDTVTTEEDVAKYLELVVLASVPEQKNGAADGDGRKRKKRKGRKS